MQSNPCPKAARARLPRPPRLVAVGAAAALIALLVCGCAAGVDLERLAEADLTPGAPLPTPVAATDLLISGRVGVGETPLRLSREALESMGLVRMEVRDPWLRRRVAYSGVLLSDLVRYLAVDEGADTLHVVSLDDYAADIPLSEVHEYDILLATRTEGEAMAIEDGGPTRVIFPYDDYPDLAVARNLSVWNISRIEVR